MRLTQTFGAGSVAALCAALLATGGATQEASTGAARLTALQTQLATLEHNHSLRTVYAFMQRLKALCAQTTGKTESDLKRLQAWCADAEASGIRALRDFARQLQAYTPQPA